MSDTHPIVAVTGSSGAGTSTARRALLKTFYKLGIDPAVVEGDGFHAFDREEMKVAIQRARVRGENFSHFGPASNHLDKLQALFAEYGAGGTGMMRRYIHNDDEARESGLPSGSFTPWTPLPEGTDLLFYEGLHGGLITDRVNIASHVDLLVGMVPTINLEWIQKISRDTRERGHTPEDVTRTILRRMPDYVNYITPQFSRTDVNFQRVPLVDTADPFHATSVPTDRESFVVIHVNTRDDLELDLNHVVRVVDSAFYSRPDTLVIPGTSMARGMEALLEPAIKQLMTRRQKAAATA